MVSVQRSGNIQYATMPGSAIVPCVEYKEIASNGIMGNGFRLMDMHTHKQTRTHKHTHTHAQIHQIHPWINYLLSKAQANAPATNNVIHSSILSPTRQNCDTFVIFGEWGVKSVIHSSILSPRRQNCDTFVTFSCEASKVWYIHRFWARGVKTVMPSSLFGNGASNVWYIRGFWARGDKTASALEAEYEPL